MGLLRSVLVFALQVLAPLLIVVWAMKRWRKPLWTRWAAGATAYIVYVHVAHAWLRTMTNWLVVGGLVDLFTVLAVGLLIVLRGGSSMSEEEIRATGTSLAKTVAWIGHLKLAWIEFALVPALVLAVAHYTRRFVVARRGARRVGDPPRA